MGKFGKYYGIYILELFFFLGLRIWGIYTLFFENFGLRVVGGWDDDVLVFLVVFWG